MFGRQVVIVLGAGVVAMRMSTAWDISMGHTRTLPCSDSASASGLRHNVAGSAQLIYLFLCLRVEAVSGLKQLVCGCDVLLLPWLVECLSQFHRGLKELAAALARQISFMRR